MTTAADLAARIDRPVHWVSRDALEELAFAGRYQIEIDEAHGFAAVVVREGTEYRAALEVA